MELQRCLVHTSRGKKESRGFCTEILGKSQISFATDCFSSSGVYRRIRLSGLSLCSAELGKLPHHELQDQPCASHGSLGCAVPDLGSDLLVVLALAGPAHSTGRTAWDAHGRPPTQHCSNHWRGDDLGALLPWVADGTQAHVVLAKGAVSARRGVRRQHARLLVYVLPDSRSRLLPEIS